MSSTQQRHLLLMRHATAALAHGGTPDFDRPLTEQGRREAAQVGQALAALSYCQPVRVICSTAVRARQTLEQVLRAGVQASQVTYEGLYYQGHVEQIIESLWEAPAGDGSLLIVGHNPTWSELATYLSSVMVSLSPAYAVVLSRQSPSWEHALASPGWDLKQKIEP